MTECVVKESHLTCGGRACCIGKTVFHKNRTNSFNFVCSVRYAMCILIHLMPSSDDRWSWDHLLRMYCAPPPLLFYVHFTEQRNLFMMIFFCKQTGHDLIQSWQTCCDICNINIYFIYFTALYFNHAFQARCCQKVPLPFTGPRSRPVRVRESLPEGAHVFLGGFFFGEASSRWRSRAAVLFMHMEGARGAGVGDRREANPPGAMPLLFHSGSSSSSRRRRG